ncbi:1870_t:CDS:2, partial [Scutellospora calospora]
MYDKCVFYSNDGKRGIWMPDRNMLLRKKGNKKSIMVNKFLLEECGQLKLSEEEIRIHLNVSTKQVRDKAIPIFEAKFPNAIAVFAFNNSTNYTVYAEDALIAKTQHMIFNKDYVFTDDDDYDKTMRGKPKGIKVVLKERGLWKDGLLLEYKVYKGKEFLGNSRINCCTRKIIASQPDFITQKSTVVELIE